MARIIAYDNVFAGADVVFSSVNERASNPLKMAFDGKLFTSWMPEATPGQYMRFTAELPEATPVDYLAIAAHNVAYDLTLEGGPDGSTWNTVYTGNPTAGAVFVASFTQATYKYWRFTLDAGGGHTIANTSYIGCIFAGAAVDIPRLAPPFSPPGITQGYDGQNNISEDGLFIGRSNYFSPFDFRLQIKNAEPAWVRQYMPGIISAIATGPFFVAWDTTNHASQCAYCWVSEAPKQAPKYNSNMLMDFDFAARGVTFV